MSSVMASQVCGAIRTLIYFWWVCKYTQPLWKTLQLYLLMLNMLILWHSDRYILNKNAHIYSPKDIVKIVHSSILIIAQTRKHLQWLILCVNLTWPQGTQIFGQTLFWSFLWGYFWVRLTFKSVEWVEQIAPPPNVGGPHPISWRLD